MATQLPPNLLGVKVQLLISETEAFDGSPLEWMSMSESDYSCSSESDSEISTYSDESINVPSDQILYASKAMSETPRARSKINQKIAIFESPKPQQKPQRVAETPLRTQVREKINQFNSTGPNRQVANRKFSLKSHDSGISSTALTTSASSFGTNSFRTISQNSAASEEELNRNVVKSTSMASIRSSSSGRMNRGMERERVKLEKLMNGGFMNDLNKKRRAKSQDILRGTQIVKNEIKKVESRERARSAVRKEKLNRKRWQSEPRVQKEAQPAPAAPESKQQKLEKDVQKNEIRLTLPQTMALEKLANMKSPSVPVSSKMAPKVETKKTVTVTERKSGKGQKIVLEETQIIKKPAKMAKGAQVTNKPLRKIVLNENVPYCFEVVHRNGKPISNLFIMPSEETDFVYGPRIRLMVECNRMRYYACFLPSQRMEHLKTLIYVLTGVVPRNQNLFYRQKMDSQVPFEGLLEPDFEEVAFGQDCFHQELSMMKPTMSSTSTFSLVASSDEAYGSDKSVSGFDETLRRGRSRTDSVKHRSRSSDVRAGKFLNKLRGQKFSGLSPEGFSSNTVELSESDFFTSYMHLLKDKRLSDDEHDARCDLLSYMQTKIETYNWKVVRQFHDQVVKQWERGLLSLDAELDTFKRHYFDGHPTKLKKKMSTYSPLKFSTFKRSQLLH